MNTETIIGVAASACTAVAMVPQLIKLLKEKKAENVSLGMMAVLSIGLGLWVCYGAMKNDWILIVSNSFSFAINLILAFFTIRYKK